MLASIVRFFYILFLPVPMRWSVGASRKWSPRRIFIHAHTPHKIGQQNDSAALYFLATHRVSTTLRHRNQMVRAGQPTTQCLFPESRCMSQRNARTCVERERQKIDVPFGITGNHISDTGSSITK